MPLKPDTENAVNDWLESQRSLLSPEEFTQLQKIYGKDDRKQFVATTVMMRSDYGRQTQQQQQDYNQKLSQLESEATRLAGYDKQLSEWEAYVRANTVSAEDYNKIAAEMTQLQNYRNQTEAKIKSLGMDELIEGLEIDDAQPTPTNQTNQSQGSQTVNNQNPNQPIAPFTTEAIVDNKINNAAISTVMGVAQLMKATNEYRELTGKELPNPDALLAESIEARTPLLDYIEQKFEFQKLRVDREIASREAEINRRVEEQVAKRVSQHQVPVPGGMGQSPVMGQVGQAMNGEAKENLPLFGKPGQAGRGAQKATEAFLSRKYNGQTYNPWSS